jgi:hypothetical protein
MAQGWRPIALQQAGLYGATRSGPPYLVAAYFPVPEPSTRATSTWRRAPRLGSWRERAGDAEGVFVPLLTGRDRGDRWSSRDVRHMGRT